MILKVVWRVLMGVLRVFEGCCRVFEVCLKGVWKNKIEAWNQSDPPPPRFSQMMPSLTNNSAGSQHCMARLQHSKGNPQGQDWSNQRLNQGWSKVIKGSHRQSKAINKGKTEIKGNQMWSKAIKGNQKQSSRVRLEIKDTGGRGKN